MWNLILTLAFTALLSGCVLPTNPASSTAPASGSGTNASGFSNSAWEAANPIVPLPNSPQGIPPLQSLPLPPSPQSVRLGRWLFYDTRLSADNTISCASCHQSNVGFSNNTAVSTGIDNQHGTRKAPPILNLASVARPFFFWDGRANSLEAQAVGPITNPIEMGMTSDALVAKLQAVPSYPQYFSQAFQTSTITMDLITQAISDYEKTRQSGGSAFDQFRAGQAALFAFRPTGFSTFWGEPLQPLPQWPDLFRLRVS